MNTLLDAAIREQFDDAPQQKDAALLGMWAFIATEILFFGVLFAAYVICRWRFGAGFVLASEHTDFSMGTLETAILLTSGYLAALAVREIRLGRARRSALLLGVTALLGLVFLILHAHEYVDEFHEGLIPGLRFTEHGPMHASIELFFSLYDITTGFHALHVIIGVVLLAIMAVRSWRGDFHADYYTPLEVAALYWGLVDIVWIFVYPAIYLARGAG